MDTYVDQHHTILNHIGCDKLGLANGYNQNISHACQFCKILGTAMAERYCAVGSFSVA